MKIHYISFGLVYILLLAMPALLSGQAQAYPITNQYFLNPFVYNPAFAGASRYTEVNASFRSQWHGLEGAPETSLLTVSIPTTSRLSLGGLFRNDERGLLRTTSGQGTIMTAVPLAEGHTLGAGISVGATYTSLRTTGLDTEIYGSDPLVNAEPFSGVDLDVSIGLRYNLGNFELGLAIPRVISPVYLVSASYRIRLSEQLSVAPNVLFRTTEGLPSRTEAGVVAYLDDKAWIGGAYRQDYGGMGFVGFRALERYTISYSYEMADMLAQGIPNSTHEIMVGIRIGDQKPAPLPDNPAEERLFFIVENAPSKKKKTESAPVQPEPVERKIVAAGTPTTPPAPPPVVKQPEAIQEPSPLLQQPVAPPPEIAPEIATIPKGDGPRVERFDSDDVREQGLEMLDNGYYVMIGAFQYQENAQRFIEKASGSGMDAKSFFNEGRNLHYVYSRYYTTSDIARATMHWQDLINHTKYKDAWIFSIEK